MRTRRNKAHAGAAAGATNYHSAATADELTERNVRAIAQLEDAARANRSRSDLIADAIAAFCGTMGFVWLHVVLFTVWIGANSVPGLRHVDPFPYTFLTLLVSLEAIFLSTFILVSQNQEQRQTERRNHLDLQINLLTEQENTKMLLLLQRIAEKVGVDLDGEKESLDVLEQATQPDKLVEQIERATRHGQTQA